MEQMNQLQDSRTDESAGELKEISRAFYKMSDQEQDECGRNRVPGLHVRGDQYHSLGYPERDLEERTVLEIIHLEKTL